RNSSEKSQSAASPSAGDCYNPFLPATPDETLEYESTFSNKLAPYSYSVTFSEVSDGTFVQHQELTSLPAAPADNALDRTFRCQPEGLVSAVYADLSRPESRLKFETLDATGVSIPKPERWQKGTRWNYSYSVRGQMSFVGAPTPVEVEGTITIAAEIMATERV